MKIFAWSGIVAFCVVILGGCAVPEKTKVTPPAPPVYSSKPPSIKTSDTSQPKQVVQPGYLDIEDQQESFVEEDIEVNLPSMAYINDRIFEYGRKLDRWKELDSQSVSMEIKEEEAVQMVQCFRELQGVLNGYSELRSRILQTQMVTAAAEISSEEIVELQKNDIAFLENECGRLLSDSDDQSVGWNQREKGADLAQLETLIDRYATNKEYEEVVNVWRQIPEFQIGRVHLRTKILYGNALMYLQQEETAARVYQQVVDQMSDSDEQATDIVSLRKVLADLYLASGNDKQAAVEYKKISKDYRTLGQLEEWSKLQLSLLDRSLEGSPELTDYSFMLRNFLGFIPEQDGYKIVWQAENFLSSYPYSPVASNVEFIKASATETADNWFNSFMSDVELLGAEKRFKEALEMLETMDTDIVSAEKQIVLKEKSDALLLAEAVDTETDKMVLIQDLQNQWNNGMLLAKAGRNDEAIAVFTNLLDTEYSVKAEAKIRAIGLEAAKEDRRKAANLFIRFTKTTDLESRKKLLIESRRVLKSILVKYPDVEIAPKVLGNIRRVEQEMNAIDPNLVRMADMVETQQVEVDGIDAAFSTEAKELTTGQAPIMETDMETRTDH